MYLQRFRNGVLQESLDGIRSLVLLAGDEAGNYFYYVRGPREEVRSLFIFGASYWPTCIPYDEDTKNGMERVLCDAFFLYREPVLKVISSYFVSARLLQSVFEDSEPVCPGECGEGFSVLDSPDSPNPFSFTGATVWLIFFETNERRGIAQDGYGSQKQILIFNAVEALWGAAVRERLENAILGPMRDLWLRMAKGMWNSAPGSITEIDDDTGDT